MPRLRPLRSCPSNCLAAYACDLKSLKLARRAHDRLAQRYAHLSLNPTGRLSQRLRWVTGIVTTALGHSVTDGALFLFVNRKRDRIKALLLDLGEVASPEVVSAVEEAIREAEQIVQDDEETKQRRKTQLRRRDDRKFPDHLSRTEQIIDLPEDIREGLKFIGYDEVETLRCKRQELYVLTRKYAKYSHPADPSQGIVSPERPTGLVEGGRFGVSRETVGRDSKRSMFEATRESRSRRAGRARRKVDECRNAFPVQVAKLESLIRMLYDIESQIKDFDDESKLARRQSLSRQVIDQIDQ